MTQPSPHLDVAQINSALEKQSAEERVAWGLAAFPGRILLTSSFGAQSAVLLHMTTVLEPELPVVLIDTGFLFSETYRFIDELTTRLRLNLKVFRPAITPGWLEARYGKLWESKEGLNQYGEIVKVEPLRRAFAELKPAAWITGLRRQQSSTRKHLGVLAEQDQVLKIHPIIDWTDKDVYQYLTEFELPYHPLWEKGYVSIGDWHSTSALTEGMTEEETRFGGLKRECGLHEATPITIQSKL